MKDSYYTHVLLTATDPAIRAAAGQALIRERLAEACKPDPVQIRLAQVCEPAIRARLADACGQQPRQ